MSCLSCQSRECHDVMVANCNWTDVVPPWHSICRARRRCTILRMIDSISMFSTSCCPKEWQGARPRRFSLAWAGSSCCFSIIPHRRSSMQCPRYEYLFSKIHSKLALQLEGMYKCSYLPLCTILQWLEEETKIRQPRANFKCAPRRGLLVLSESFVTGVEWRDQNPTVLIMTSERRLTETGWLAPEAQR